MSRRVLLPSLLAVVIGAAVLSAAQRRPPIEATWRTSVIVVDGDDADWSVSASEVEKTPLFMSVVNDATHLYLRLRTSDPAGRAQWLRGGLVVSFDAAGGERRTLAVKYPVGTPPPLPDSRDRARQRPDGEGRGRTRPGDANDGADIASLVPSRLEVYGPGKDEARSIVLDQATGLEVRIARQQETVVYELKVPLARNDAHPFAIGAQPGRVIGLGLESPKWEAQARSPLGSPGGGLGGRPGGGMGGMGGMGGGRGGQGRTGGMGPGAREDERPAQPKPWKVWTTVHLAREP
jgi:hypothetical protein